MSVPGTGDRGRPCAPRSGSLRTCTKRSCTSRRGSPPAGSRRPRSGACPTADIDLRRTPDGSRGARPPAPRRHQHRLGVAGEAEHRIDVVPVSPASTTAERPPRPEVDGQTDRKTCRPSSRPCPRSPRRRARRSRPAPLEVRLSVEAHDPARGDGVDHTRYVQSAGPVTVARHVARRHRARGSRWDPRSSARFASPLHRTARRRSAAPRAPWRWTSARGGAIQAICRGDRLDDPLGRRLNTRSPPVDVTTSDRAAVAGSSSSACKSSAAAAHEPGNDLGGIVTARQTASTTTSPLATPQALKIDPNRNERTRKIPAASATPLAWRARPHRTRRARRRPAPLRHRRAPRTPRGAFGVGGRPHPPRSLVGAATDHRLESAARFPRRARSRRRSDRRHRGSRARDRRRSRSVRYRRDRSTLWARDGASACRDPPSPLIHRGRRRRSKNRPGRSRRCEAPGARPAPHAARGWPRPGTHHRRPDPDRAWCRPCRSRAPSDRRTPASEAATRESPHAGPELYVADGSRGAPPRRRRGAHGHHRHAQALLLEEAFGPVEQLGHRSRHVGVEDRRVRPNLVVRSGRQL